MTLIFLKRTIFTFTGRREVGRLRLRSCAASSIRVLTDAPVFEEKVSVCLTWVSSSLKWYLLTDWIHLLSRLLCHAYSARLIISDECGKVMRFILNTNWVAGKSQGNKSLRWIRWSDLEECLFFFSNMLFLTRLPKPQIWFHMLCIGDPQTTSFWLCMSSLGRVPFSVPIHQPQRRFWARPLCQGPNIFDPTNALLV